jgi:hypothetical protein
VDSFSSNIAVIALVLAGLGLVLLFVIQSLQVSRLKQRLSQLTGGVEGGDFEAVLGEHLETVHQVGRDLDELTARMAVVESAARHFFSREGLVRFNPFPDTGGNQSFALALLDESDDGVIVSSLHSRTGTRIYAKAVIGGKADTSLSSEEQEAIDEARAKRNTRPSTVARSAASSRPAPAGSGAVAATPVARPAPAARSVVAVTPTPAPVPAPVLAPRAATPAPAARQVAPATPAPTARAAAVPAVEPVRGPSDMHADESASRPMNLRAKGQEKVEDLSIPDDGSGVDPDKVARKPGQR